jgi:drug/metabolite transporter (DMT)-like permease
LPEFQFFLPALVARNPGVRPAALSQTTNANVEAAPVDSQNGIGGRHRYDILFVALLGFATFFCSPLFQYFGLRHSTAVENAVIVAMEPLLSVLLAALVLRERMGLKRWTALAVALLGFCLLSCIFEQDLAHGFSKSMVGNILILAFLLGEITFIIFGSRLVKRLPSSAVFAVALSFGLLFLTIFTAATSGIPAFWNLTGRAFWGVMWLGPLSTAGGYLVWMSMLRRVPVNLVAMTLFVQPVVGSIFGALFLHEQLGLTQWLGGALIIAAVIAQTR